MSRRSVFVGVDSHNGGHDAVAFGATLAVALGDELVLAHIHPFDAWGDNLAFGTPHDTSIERQAAGIVEEAGQGAPVPFRKVVAPHRSTAGGLHEEAVRAQAELLVVGSSHRGLLGRVTLGSHSERVLHGAPCAVAVVPLGLGDSGWALRKITVGYDESEDASHAVDSARRLAAASGAELTLMGVIDPRGHEQRRREKADQALRQVAAEGEETELRAGSTVEQLLLAARETDLLVLGSRGYGPVRRVLVGSTVHHVVREAACPVVIAPRVGAER